MRKKILSMLIGFMVLAAGCSLKPKNEKKTAKTMLNIKNESSINVKNIKYDGKEASFSKNNEKENILSMGDTCNVNLDGESKGYIFFTVFSAEKEINVPVRTNETIIVEKGKSATFVLTDNMLVVPVGKTAAVKLLNLIHPAVLKVHNETSWDITEISYGGKTHKETLASGGEWKTSFSESMSGELKIKILQNKDKSAITLKLKDNISIEVGDTKEIKITNTTLAMQEGKTEIEEIRRILGMSVLTVINESSAEEISGISFGEVTHAEPLKQNASCDLEVQNSADYLTFYVKTTFTTFKVKTSTKITLESKKDKKVIINNNTDVLVLALKSDDGEFPTGGDDLTKVLKLQKVVEAALLDISNKSSAKLLNVTYDKCNVGSLDAYDGKAEEAPWAQFDVWDFPTTATHITFEISLSSKVIKLKTVEPIVLASYEKTLFTFTNKTEVINVETGDKTSIRKVIGLSSLTVVNETTAKLSDITYSQQKTDKSFVLSQGEKWEVEFNKQVEDYLSFKIQDKQITVKTAGKISINAGEEKIFKITKDTSVIPSDIQEATTVHKVIHAAKLEITNGSSAKLCNVKYGNRTFGDLTIEDEGDYINSLNYYELASTALPIFFEVQTPKRKVKVKTEETIKLNENDNIDFTIKDTTRVIIEETGKTVFIRNILGINELKIINQTSANKISKLTFADKTLEDLPKGDTWTIEFNAPIENNLFFVIKTEVFEKPLEVSTKEKIQLINEDKTFTITDDTLVILKGVEHALKLSDILNSAGLLIYNESDFGMHNINYGGPIFKYIPSKYHNGFVVWGAEIERYPISFQIFSNTIQLTTQESFVTQPRHVTEIHIKNSTLVEYEGNVVELGSFLNQTYKANDVIFEMRRIEEVKDAVLGSNDKIFNGDKEYIVSLSAYSIGRTEVTQGLWEAVMGSNPSEYKDFLKPVNSVHWFDCIKFCNKLTELVMGAEHCVYTIEQTYNGEAITAADFNKKGFRLPTGAEWEYAALGGASYNMWAGCNTEEDLWRYAWYKDNSYQELHKVGTRDPNGYGLYDMSGNINEMCWDENANIVGGNDPIGECLFPIYRNSEHWIGLRGGSFFNEANYCLVRSCGCMPITFNASKYRGLRLVCRP